MAEPSEGAHKRLKTEARLGSGSQSLDEPSCLAKECIRLHLISSKEEFDSPAEKSFYPDFVDEYFGESGKIYGYQTLKVDIWLHASSFHAFARVECRAAQGAGRPKPDIHVVLKDMFGAGLVDDQECFLGSLSRYDDEFKAMLESHGEIISTWNGRGTSGVSQIFRLELKIPEVRAWHTRVNPLVLMLVEAAVPLDDQDPLWEVYVATGKSSALCVVAGLCNVFRYFHYPDSSRMRISQILVLPPYQKQRYGYHLMNSIYEVARSRNCYDVTMEEPSEKLQHLRDIMDVVRLASCSSLVSQLTPLVRDIVGGNASREVMLPKRELISMVRGTFKIGETQFKRSWEVLLFLHIDPRDTVGRSAFVDLLTAKFHWQLYSGHAKHSYRVRKQVVDTDVTSKAFVMAAFRDVIDGHQQQQQQQQDQQGQQCALQQLLEERVDDIKRLARKVASVCHEQALSVTFDVQGWLQ